MKKSKKHIIWDKILEYHISELPELTLVTEVCGFSVETLNDVVYARTGYETIEQYEIAHFDEVK